MPRVYVLILNYKKWMDVSECLGTLLRSDHKDYSAIIVDNDSQNNSLENLVAWARGNVSSLNITGYKYLSPNAMNSEIIPAAFPQLVFIQNDKNKGFAGGINTILKWLLQEDAYVWLLNPDMTVDASALSELVKFAGTSPRKSIVGTVINYHANPGKVHLYGGGRINFNSATVKMITDKNDIGRLDYISGGSFFTHAGNFNELGLLPEEYFLYWEETDCCYRAKKQGYQLLLCETATCYDKVSTSIGKSFLSDYYYTRNGLFFLSKYKKGKVPIAIFFTIFRLLKRIFSARFDRAKGMYRGLLSFLNHDKHAYK
ncbi:MAG: glycosyltransferase family 2 protein [Ferruginibacter sp.]